jgi:hypothetical protein
VLAAWVLLGGGLLAEVEARFELKFVARQVERALDDLCLGA